MCVMLATKRYDYARMCDQGSNRRLADLMSKVLWAGRLPSLRVAQPSGYRKIQNRMHIPEMRESEYAVDLDADD